MSYETHFGIDCKTYGNPGKIPYPYQGTTSESLLKNVFIGTSCCPTWNVNIQSCGECPPYYPRVQQCFEDGGFDNYSKKL